MLIDDAGMKRNKFDAKLNALSKYFPKKKEYIEAKNKLLDNAKNLYKGRKKIIEGFKKGLFPLKSDDEFKKQARYENIRNENDLIDYKSKSKSMELIKSKENEMNNELVSKYFFVQKLGNLLKPMKDLKNNPEKNKKLASILESGLKDLKEEIKEMSKKKEKLKNQKK